MLFRISFLSTFLLFPIFSTTCEAAKELIKSKRFLSKFFFKQSDEIANIASPAPTLSITLDANAGAI